MRAVEAIAGLVRAFGTIGRSIIVPTHQGRRGHPLLFSTRYRNEVLTCHDDTGLRGLLAAHPEDVFEMETRAPEVLEDVDTPADYPPRGPTVD